MCSNYCNLFGDLCVFMSRAGVGYKDHISTNANQCLALLKKKMKRIVFFQIIPDIFSWKLAKIIVYLIFVRVIKQSKFRHIKGNHRISTEC